SLVIASGGGGIPVVKHDEGNYEGIDAVIDKDRSGFKLADEVGADIFMILTDVDNVYVNFGKPDEKALGEITLKEAQSYVDEGQFATGSMGPKIEAAMDFAKKGGRSIICSLEKSDRAVEGKAGTHIIG